MTLVDIGAASLHYDTCGAGSPLIVVLPQSTGPRGNRVLMDALASRHTVVTYDQRGSGRSTGAQVSCSMDAQADDVLALMDALAIRSSALLCHSTGCGIGLALAARRPERVSHLVLVTPWSHADPHLVTMQTLRKAAARALDPEQYARFNAALLFPPEYRRANEPGFSELARLAPESPQDPETIARRLDAILEFDARALCDKVRCPTRVVTASDDQLMPAWFGAEIADRIEAADLVALDGGGHMLLETRGAEVAAAVLAFLDSDGSG